MRSRRRLALLVVAAVALPTLGACGLPNDREPRTITAADAPLDLAQQSGQSPTTLLGDDEVRLYFLREGELRAVVRSAPVADVDTAISLLLAGPTDAETTLTTVIPPETTLLAATVDGDTAILDLGCAADAPTDSCGLLGVGGQDQLTVFAQLACTATDIAGIEGVRFLQAGQGQDAPTDSGTIRSPGLVTCDDYRSLVDRGA